MIHVLHLGLSSNPGGVENFVLNYHRNIDRSKVNFDYLDIYGDGIAFSEEIHNLGGKIFALPNYKRHPIVAVRKFRNVLDNNKFDIVHIHMQSTANLMPITVALSHKKEIVVCHSHSSSTPKGILRKVLNAVNTKKLRKAQVEKWACGHYAGAWMWGSDFTDENIIPNAIDYDKYKFNKETRYMIRNHIGIAETDKVIGFVGRFGDEKNIYFLIEILKELRKISQNYKLLTVGGNDSYDKFLKKLKSEGLREFYYSAGVQASARDWYQAMDAFLLPSFFEGFPIVAVEAQAAGLICFFSNRISKEIDINKNSMFLSIEKGNALKWAKIINNYVFLNKRNNYNFPNQFKIQEAAPYLTDKYEALVNLHI